MSCGHVTIVNAMHLGIAVLISKSSGIADYVEQGINGLICTENTPQSWANEIKLLWLEPVRSEVMGKMG